jgi:cation diffusion facilitator CzcD-associated flavoprotein CzcO
MILGQSEILAYLNAYVDYYQLRPLIHLNITVSDAVWNASENKWKVTSDKGLLSIFLFYFSFLS